MVHSRRSRRTVVLPVSAASAPTALPADETVHGGDAPPHAAIWLILCASGAAVLIAGSVATALMLARLGRVGSIPWAFWRWFVVASGLTIASLGLRAMRWVFLLRRTEVRIPIRDACIGYFSGFTLLFVPF